MSAWGVTRFKRVNGCHPEVRHYALGLCWPCYRARPEWKAKERAYYERNRDRWRQYRKTQRASYRREAKRYGIEAEAILAMLKAQGGLCAICGKPPGRKRLAVDHDHRTGAVRAMLCVPCNTALGAFGDSVEALERAIGYLRRHSVQTATTAA